LFADIGFEPVKILRRKQEIDAVELLRAPALLPVQGLHPAVQVWMLAPVMQLLALEGFEIDRGQWLLGRDKRVHIKTDGFFFGKSNGSEQEDDLAFVAKARKAIAAGQTVFYSSWW
jgi:hypothetical protein